MPLNEETESYRIQVKAKGQLKRELMVGTSVWDYTVTMRADDGVVGGRTRLRLHRCRRGLVMGLQRVPSLLRHATCFGH